MVNDALDFSLLILHNVYETAHGQRELAWAMQRARLLTDSIVISEPQVNWLSSEDEMEYWCCDQLR